MPSLDKDAFRSLVGLISDNFSPDELKFFLRGRLGKKWKDYVSQEKAFPYQVQDLVEAAEDSGWHCDLITVLREHHPNPATREDAASLHHENCEQGEAAREPEPSPSLPPRLAFLGFFPEGLMQPLYRWLIARRGLARTPKAELLRKSEIDGTVFYGLDPKYLDAARETIEGAAGPARELLQEIELFVAEEEVYDHVVDLGRGRTQLLRDQLRLTEMLADSPEDGELCAAVAARALGFIPRIVAENEVRLGFEILTQLRRFFPPTARDRVVEASLALRHSQAELALELFELERGDELFADSDLTALERLGAAQDWAKAAKDAGRAAEMHRTLVDGYRQMLDLVDTLPPDGGGDVRRLKIELLNNRATQLAVHGDEDDWAVALTDLEQAGELAEAPRYARYRLQIQANRAALTVDRLAEGERPPAELVERLQKLHSLAGRQKADSGLFFFHYQLARLLKRRGQSDEAIEEYARAGRIAHRAGLESRAAIADRWSLKLGWQARNITNADYLEGLEACARVFAEHPGDAWSANALIDTLAWDIADVHRMQGDTAAAWQAASRAFGLQCRRPMRGAPQRARAKLDELLALLREIGIADDAGEAFVDEHRECLGELLGKQSWELTWSLVAAPERS